MSPSTRKVWIEIVGVVRAIEGENRHLPHGRCGLNFAVSSVYPYYFMSPPTTFGIALNIYYKSDNTPEMHYKKLSVNTSKNRQASLSISA